MVYVVSSDYVIFLNPARFLSQLGCSVSVGSLQGTTHEWAPLHRLLCADSPCVPSAPAGRSAWGFIWNHFIGWAPVPPVERSGWRGGQGRSGWSLPGSPVPASPSLPSYCHYSRVFLHSLPPSPHLTVFQLSSVPFIRSVVSDSATHGLQHARLPCPSPTPGVYSNSCPSSRWCYLTISSSVVPFSSCPQSFPASGSFPRSRLFASGGQSVGASASPAVLSMNIQGWFL